MMSERSATSDEFFSSRGPKRLANRHRTSRRNANYSLYASTAHEKVGLLVVVSEQPGNIVVTSQVQAPHQENGWPLAVRNASSWIVLYTRLQDSEWTVTAVRWGTNNQTQAGRRHALSWSLYGRETQRLTVFKHGSGN